MVGLTEILTCNNDLDAAIAKGILEENGIRVFVRKDDCGGMEPQLQLTEGVKILVPLEDAERAGILLNHNLAQNTMNAGQSEEGSWICSNCGEIHENQFSDCWNCGSPRH